MQNISMQLNYTNLILTFFMVVQIIQKILLKKRKSIINIYFGLIKRKVNGLPVKGHTPKPNYC